MATPPLRFSSSMGIVTALWAPQGLWESTRNIKMSDIHDDIRFWECVALSPYE